MPRLAPILLALAFATPACKSKTADCAGVGDKVVALIRVELERETEDDDRKRRVSMLPALKEELEGKCKAEQWSEAARICMAKAKSIAELEKCDPDRDFENKDEPPKDQDKAP